MLRQFYACHLAWYSKDIKREEEIMFGLYDEDGGCEGEMAIRWHQLGGATPRLEVFNDAWHLLPQFADVIEKLAGLSAAHPTPKQIMVMLKECGFTDRTQYEDPDENTTRALKQSAMSKLTAAEAAAIGARP